VSACRRTFALVCNVASLLLWRPPFGPAGKSRGFAFLAYEDQRSTVLSVDNLSGARVAGRVIRVEHVDNYKRKRAEVSVLDAPAEASWD